MNSETEGVSWRAVRESEKRVIEEREMSVVANLRSSLMSEWWQCNVLE